MNFRDVVYKNKKRLLFAGIQKVKHRCSLLLNVWKKVLTNGACHWQYYLLQTLENFILSPKVSAKYQRVDRYDNYLSCEIGGEEK
jgi:hypothetical protein